MHPVNYMPTMMSMTDGLRICLEMLRRPTRIYKLLV